MKGMSINLIVSLIVLFAVAAILFAIFTMFFNAIPGP